MGLGSPKIYVFDLIPDRRRGAADKNQRYGSTRTRANRRPNGWGSRLLDRVVLERDAEHLIRGTLTWACRRSSTL